MPREVVQPGLGGAVGEGGEEGHAEGVDGADVYYAAGVQHYTVTAGGGGGLFGGLARGFEERGEELGEGEDAVEVEGEELGPGCVGVGGEGFAPGCAGVVD